jgi:26S proteasome regulatory subunit N2
MPGLTSAAGLIGLLDEPDTDLRNYALQQLDVYVHQFWPEIADEVSKM